MTNGLLVVELMSGNLQVGDDTFKPLQPADINIVGDPGFAETPTYADYATLMDDPAFAEGSVITASVDGDGNIGNNPDLGEWNVTAGELAPDTGHRTASVFWEFMVSSGNVYEDGAFVNDLLFLNPYYATGLPITEAYWSRVMVAGSEQWVLTQAFERRVMTYTPSNNAGFQVEAGNVGLHYHEWRYESAPPPTGTATVTTFDNDGTTVQGGVLVEAYALASDETCSAVTFGTDEPTATGTTDTETGVYTFADLAVGEYCFGADFDGDLTADDATAVATVSDGGTVTVSLEDPAGPATLTVKVLNDEDMAIVGATVELFAGTCAALASSATPVATRTTVASGVAVLDVDALADGGYCVIAMNSRGGVIGEADVTLPDDTDVTIGGVVAVTVESTTGANEVQTLAANGVTGGTFKLSYAGVLTGSIAYNATAAQIQAALVALPNIGADDVAVTGGPLHMADVLVEFTGNLGYTNVEPLIPDDELLTGGTVDVTTTTPGAAGVNEVQTLTVSGATGGTFTLAFGIAATAAIAHNATAADIDAALEALSTIGSGNVAVTGGPLTSTEVAIEFTGELAAQNVPQIAANSTNLGGGTAVVDMTTEGATGTNEVQTLAASGATGGTFRLALGIQSTGPLSYNATAATIQVALSALPSVGLGQVAVTGGPINTTDVVIDFTGTLAAKDVAQISADSSNLDGGTVEVTTMTTASAPVVQILSEGAGVSGGTFTLTFDSATTAPLAYDATAAQIEAALELLSTITNVTVMGDLSPGASTTITFMSPASPTSLLVVNDNLIT